MVPDDCLHPNHFMPCSGENTQSHERESAPLDCEDWDALPYDDRLPFILAFEDPAQWFERYALDVLTGFRNVPWEWGKIKAVAKQRGVNVWDLEKAVDALLAVMRAEAQTSGVSSTSASPSPSECLRFQPITAADLYAKDLPPLTYVVDDILPIGATLFVGRAKDGKSLAMWNLCMAVAEGGLAFGRYKAQQSDVLYLALEDGERRAKKRLTDQMQAMGMTAPPARLSLVLWEAPRLGEGLEEALTAWLDAHAGAKLIVIDILEKVRPRRSRNGSVYQEDYLALAPLQRIAQERGIAIVIVHHANKGKSEDFRDAISGAMSLAGAADTLWVLQRLAGEADAALRITGREVETLDLALQFRDGFWTALGDAEAYRLKRASKEVVEALQNAGKPMTPKQLAQYLGVAEATIRQRLVRMAERGEVLNLGDGRYIARTQTQAARTNDDGVTPVTDVTPVTPVTQVTERASPTESNGRVTDDTAECHAEVTLVTYGKEKGVDEVSDSVTGVTPSDARGDTTATNETPPETPAGHGPSLAASVLWCTPCGQAQPVVLIGREYRCERCGTVVGVRTATAPATNGHTNGHDTGGSPGMAIPCAVCGSRSRWNDRGTLRCIRCWPPSHAVGNSSRV